MSENRSRSRAALFPSEAHREESSSLHPAGGRSASGVGSTRSVNPDLHERQLLACPQQGVQAATRSAVRDDIYRLVGELKAVGRSKQTSAGERSEAAKIEAQLRPTVEYAPWGVRILSALCLGTGTMIGYKRVVRTLGERLGKTHLTPARGASAEVVGAGLIATAGFTGLPVSTTHVITSGIAGTMVGSGSGVNKNMLLRIVAAWVCTLPVTIVAAAGLFYLLGKPS